MSRLHETFRAVLLERDPILAQDFFELPQAAREAARAEITGYFAGCVLRNEAASLAKVREILQEAR